MKKALVVQTGDWIPDTDQLVEYLESLRIALGDNYYIIVALFGGDVKCITEEDAIQHLKLSVEILKKTGKNIEEIVKLIQED